MYVRELLAQKRQLVVRSIRPTGTLTELANSLRQHNIGALLVTDEHEELVGIVSERDLARAVADFGNDIVDQPVNAIMSRSVIACTPDDNIIQLLAKMNEKQIRHMPVVKDGKPLSMISIREFDLVTKRLQAQSRTDDLTGLANRRYFLEILDKELSRHKRFYTPFSVAILDIDHFKHVNDTFGHEAGDEVICALAKLLTRELRTIDGIGRIGGEEFAILFPGTSIANAELVCERLIAAIRAEEVVTDEGSIRFTASFGLSEANPDTADTKTLLKVADKSLYKAKHDGRNRISVSSPDKSETQFGPPNSASIVEHVLPD